MVFTISLNKILKTNMNTTTTSTKNIANWFKRTVFAVFFVTSISLMAQGNSGNSNGGNGGNGGNGSNNTSTNPTNTTQSNGFTLLTGQTFSKYLNASGSSSLTNSEISTLVSNLTGAFSTSNNITYSCTASTSAFNCDNATKDYTVNITVNGTAVQGNNTFNHQETGTITVKVIDNLVPVARTKNITIYLNENGIATLTASDINNGSTDNCTTTISISKSTFNCSNKGENTVTLTVSDKTGNSSSSDAVVTVVDEIKPTAVTKNITAYLNASGSASIVASDVNNNSSDNCGNVSLSIDKSSFTCANKGNNTIVLTVTDESNNVSTANAVVTVVDEIAPTAVTKNITAYLNASGTASIVASDVNNNSSDNCGNVSLSIDKSSFTCANKGNNTVVLTVTDESNNVSTANAVVTVVDNIKPTAIAKDINVALKTGSASITAADVNNGSYDNCGNVTLNIDRNSFSCSDNGTYAVTLTVTDESGNSSNATSYVTISTVQGVSIAANNSYVYYGAITPADRSTMTATATNCSNCTYEWSNGDKGQTSTYVANGSTNITRKVTVTDGNGCTANASIKLCVFDIRCGTNNSKVSMYKSNNQLCVATSAIASQLSSGSKYGISGTNYSCNNTPGSMAQSTPTEIDVKTSNAYFDNQNRAIHFLMENEEKVTVEIYSIDGRLLQTAFNETVSANIQYVANIQTPNSNTMCYVVVRSASGFSKSFMMF